MKSKPRLKPPSMIKDSNLGRISLGLIILIMASLLFTIGFQIGLAKGRNLPKMTSQSAE